MLPIEKDDREDGGEDLNRCGNPSKWDTPSAREGWKLGAFLLKSMNPRDITPSEAEGCIMRGGRLRGGGACSMELVELKGLSPLGGGTAYPYFWASNCIDIESILDNGMLSLRRGTSAYDCCWEATPGNAPAFEANGPCANVFPD